MRSRSFLLSLVLGLFASNLVLADDGNRTITVKRDAQELASLEPEKAKADPLTGEEIHLAPGETLTIKTETTYLNKPSMSGIYVDCLPDKLCELEQAEDSQQEGINWAGVKACCAEGNLQCFWVNSEGRSAMTDHFFRCVTANTPDSPLVKSSKQVADAEPAAATKKSAKRQASGGGKSRKPQASSNPLSRFFGK